MNNGRRAVFSLKGPVRGATIACDSGTVWITQAGDIKDYVLRAGMDFTVPGEGSVAIQVMQDAGIAIRLPNRDPGRLRRLFRKCGFARPGSNHLEGGAGG